MPAGRPLKFNSPEELQEKIDKYFEICDETGRPYTVTGLAVALDTNRETLRSYGEKEEYSDTIKKAKAKCEQYLEEGMLTGKLNATASIFSAKNNYGWKDVQEFTGDAIKVNIVQFNARDYNSLPVPTERIPATFSPVREEIQDSGVPQTSREIEDGSERASTEDTD